MEKIQSYRPVVVEPTEPITTSDIVANTIALLVIVAFVWLLLHFA